jgi:TolA-binding protein
MDHEKFDQHLMDYLFDELDEVTRAAMKRKIESDAASREIEAGLRATIDVAHLPLEEPDDDLEERILAAASAAEEREPWTRKLLRSLSWAGSHAMRPQLAMAAVLMLVLGSSMLLLRVRSGAVSVTPTKDDDRSALPGEVAAVEERAERDTPPPAPVREQGEPQDAASTQASVRPAPVAASSGEPLNEDVERVYERAMANYNAGSYAEAQRDFAAVQQSKSPLAPNAALLEARSVRGRSGCQAAIAFYNKVRTQHGGSAVAADATWEQADCHRILGQAAQARELWLALQKNKAYEGRATNELQNQGESANAGGDASQSRKRNEEAGQK